MSASRLEETLDLISAEGEEELRRIIALGPLVPKTRDEIRARHARAMNRARVRRFRAARRAKAQRRSRNGHPRYYRHECARCGAMFYDAKTRNLCETCSKKDGGAKLARVSHKCLVCEAHIEGRQRRCPGCKRERDTDARKRSQLLRLAYSSAVRSGTDRVGQPGGQGT